MKNLWVMTRAEAHGYHQGIATRCTQSEALEQSDAWFVLEL
jgi:hypothetical protein